MSPDEFIFKCSSMLAPSDAALLQYCCYDPKLAVETVESTGSAFLDLLILWERVLHLNLVALRSAKLNRPLPGEPPHDLPRAEAVARTAFGMEDPLEAELYIDRARWGALEDMVGIDYFGVNNVFAYLLKLNLLERRQLFNDENGLEKYRELYSNILNAFPSNKEDK